MVNKKVSGKKDGGEPILYSKVVQNSPDPIIVIDVNGKIIQVNRAWEKLIGYKSNEVLGRAFDDFVLEQDIPIVKREIYEIIKIRKTREITINIWSKRGKPKPIEANIAPLTEKQRAVALIIVGRDVTERKKAEKNLRQSETRYRELVDESTEPILEIDLNGKILYVNHAIEQEMEYSKKEIIGKPFAKLLTPLSAKTAKAAITRLVATRKSHPISLDIITKNGKKRFYDVHGKIMPHGYNREKIVVYAHNMTSRKELEQRLTSANETLRLKTIEMAGNIKQLAGAYTKLKLTQKAVKDNEAKYRTLFESSPDSIIEIDLQGTVLSTNPAFKEEMGYSSKEAVGKHINAFLTPKSAEFAAKSMRELLTLKDKKVVDSIAKKLDEFELITKSGKKKTYGVRTTMVYKEGKPEGITIYARNITEQKKAEEQIESLSRFPNENPNPIIRIGFDNKLLYMNSAGKQILKKAGISHIQLMKHVIPKDKKATEKIMRTGKPSDEMEVKIGDRIYNYMLVPVKNQEYINIYAYDITEKKEAEKALEINSARYNDLFETITQGIVYQEASGKIVSANSAAEEILGLTLEQMQGRTSMDPRWKSFNDDGSPLHGRNHPSMVALRTGKPVRNFVMGVFHPKKKSCRWILINAVPLFKKGQKKPHQVYAIFDDITEQKGAEEKEKDRAKELNCLYALSEIVEEPGITTEGILKKTAVMMSKGWHFPEHACATITFEGKTYNSKECKPTKWKQEAILKINNQNAGNITVFYKKNLPFLKEEKQLLDALAERLGRIIERKDTKEKLNTSNKMLRAKTQEMANNINQFAVANQKLTAAEKEIKTLKNFLELQIKEMPIALITWDNEFRVKTWNPGATNLFGFSEEYAIGKHPYDFIVPKSAQPQVEKIWEQVRIHGKITGSVNENITKSGKTVLCKWSNIPIKEKGELVGILSMIQDITEQKKAEEALKKSEVKYKAYIENNPHGVFVADAKGKYIEVNNAACTTSGYTKQELLKKHISEMVPKEDRKKAIEGFKQFVKTGRIDAVMRYVKKDKTIGWWRVNGVKISNDRYMGITTDVTEKKESGRIQKDGEKGERLSKQSRKGS